MYRVRDAVVGENLTPIREYSSTVKNRRKWVTVSFHRRQRFNSSLFCFYFTLLLPSWPFSFALLPFSFTFSTFFSSPFPIFLLKWHRWYFSLPWVILAYHGRAIHFFSEGWKEVNMKLSCQNIDHCQASLFLLSFDWL